MSALLAVFGPGAQQAALAEPAMRSKLGAGAGSQVERYAATGVHVLATRHDWESTLPGWSGPLIASDESWVVAADAALYYVEDLRRRLGGPGVGPGATSADLLLAALHRFGDHFGNYVEGEFAVIAWERRTQRVLLARDQSGRRTLVRTVLPGGTIVAASAARSVARFPGVARELDPVTLAAGAAGVECGPRATGFKAIQAVAPGDTEAHSWPRVELTSSWRPPAVRTDWEDRIDPGAVERFRHILWQAIRERLPGSGVSTVWMSGGWDSTAVFALAAAGASTPVVPVSIAYPPGDSGNEDGYVNAVADHYHARVSWVASESAPIFGPDAEWPDHDDPMMHAFSAMLRVLARATRAAGGRVAFDGAGGDHVLMMSTGAVMGQHLFDGRWPEVWKLARVWRRSWRGYARLFLLPNLSPALRQWISAVRGKPLRGFWERALPAWIVPPPGLVELRRAALEPFPGEGPAQFETRFMFSPHLGRILSWSHHIALEEGVLASSPFLDRRVIEFMASRPLSDRGAAPDTKRILRRAMEGWLPAEVLKTRFHKTGTPLDYFQRQMAGHGIAEISDWVESGPLGLETAGVVDREALSRAIARFKSTGDPEVGSALMQTLAVEKWIARESVTQ